jgi:hypothetical protein
VAATEAAGAAEGAMVAQQEKEMPEVAEDAACQAIALL